MSSFDVGTQAVIRPPLPAGEIFVSRRLVDISGQPIQGYVTVYPDLPLYSRVLSSTNAFIDPSSVQYPLDKFGTYKFTLPDSSLCTPSGIVFVIKYAGFKYKFESDIDNRDNQPAPQPVYTSQITGTVLDLSYNPVSNLVVACTPLVIPYDDLAHMVDFSIMVPITKTTLTDENGNYSFTVFSSGSYRDLAPELHITAAYNIDYTQATPV